MPNPKDRDNIVPYWYEKTMGIRPNSYGPSRETSYNPPLIGPHNSGYLYGNPFSSALDKILNPKHGVGALSTQERDAFWARVREEVKINPELAKNLEGVPNGYENQIMTALAQYFRTPKLQSGR